MNALKTPSVLWSLLLGIGVFILDRLHKFIQIDIMGWIGGEIVHVTGFFDYMLIWNTGISWGLMSGVSAQMLLAIMVAAMAALSVWWWKDTAYWTRLGIALAIGGALSNALDRVIWGAVADFFHFYAGGYSFSVFNIADVAITFGVILLIFDAFRPKTSQTETS